MNIKQAKEQIKNAMVAYFTKDEFGNYVIPIEKQRPVFLLGAPGIGKTAIMEQIARELNVGLVSYSMTHHTRQSALGLPMIVKRKFGNEEYEISEYTMSEIIASVYKMIEMTGKKEGILFLDEINCVSETLAPVMLQFLQYKVFGMHRVPDGWIVVTAGNPPEFNNSVRKFDVVTWDRLKKIDVEPDFDVWKEYAYQTMVHPSVLTYLECSTEDFYRIETTVDGKNIVTARGWSDLSDMLKLYERNSINVDENLIGQYLQDQKTAKNFSAYYDLFKKYRSDYQIGSILNGTVSKTIKERAKKAPFDERLAVLGLLIDSISEKIGDVCVEEDVLRELLSCLKEIKLDLTKSETDPLQCIQRQIDAKNRLLIIEKKAGTVSESMKKVQNKVISILDGELHSFADNEAENKEILACMIRNYESRVKALNEKAGKTGTELSNVFKFCEEVFNEGQELLILVTELTINPNTSRFISRYGCDEYFKHNKELLFYERQKEIITRLDDLTLD